MDSIQIYVGLKIKFYRKLKKLTIDDLSVMINKSKATISKYENGNISIDIQTLWEIANVLGVEIRQLVDYKKVKSNQINIPGKLFGNQSILYLYHYDGRKKEVIKSVLQLNNGNDGSENIIEVSFYSNIKSYDDFENCQYLYLGTMKVYDIVTYFTLQNQANILENVNLITLNPLEKSAVTIGSISGISNKPIAPVTYKILISKNIIPDNQIPIEKLLFSKEDFRIMKLYNIILLGSD